MEMVCIRLIVMNVFVRSSVLSSPEVSSREIKPEASVVRHHQRRGSSATRTADI